ncbi:MAG: NAD(P)H-dependent oxidoreductase subunit E [Bdellovibrionota bacterium]
MFQLSKDGLAFVKNELTRYETKRSAVLPALFKAQEENGGWVSPEVVVHLSQVMDIPMSQINEVLTFYTMYNKKPVGKHHIQVCCNISCAMAGAHEMADYLCDKLGVHDGEMTKDGRFTISRAECLGSCDTAPVMQINMDEYIENLTYPKLDQMIKELK